MRLVNRERLAMWAALALIAAYQLQLMPFFSPWFASDKTIWPLFYYGFWSFVLTSTALTFSRTAIPPIFLFAGLIGITLLYPIGIISKNFIVALIFLSSMVSLAHTAGARKVLQISATVTALNACICLVDILFVHGLTNTPGRASGLSINPNLAAIGLVLGAAASYWIVPRRLLGYFLLLVGAGLFVTLSKSALVTYLLIFVIAVGVGTYKAQYSFRPMPHLGFVALMVCWVALALHLNSGFVFHTSAAYRGLSTALDKFKEARDSIATAASIRTPNPSLTEPTTAPSAIPSAPAPNTQVVIDELSRRVEDEGDVNSISARGLLMERAWLNYWNTPVLGIGLGGAHALQPHNSFLLFALAFGLIGWLVPTIFVAMVRQNPALAAATFAAAMVSHDIFLMPALLCPWAIDFAANLSLRSEVATCAP